MNFVFDSTGDFPVAANPHSSRGKKTDKNKGAGQKGKASGNLSTPHQKKRKRTVLEAEQFAEGEAQNEAQFEKDPNSPPRPLALAKETEQAERARKGKQPEDPEPPVRPEHPAGAVPSFPQTYEFDEAELVATLAGQLPPPVPNVGYIWRVGFPPQYPESVAMHLPGVSKTRDPKKRPEEMDAFSREMFRATQLPYMVEQMKTNPELVIGRASSFCFEMGSMLVHLWDDLKKRQGEFFIPEMDHTKLASAQIENKWWQNCALAKLRESQKAQNELRAMERAKQVVEEELSAHTVAISILEEENAALKRDLEASRKREEEMSREAAVLHQKLADANPEGLAERFLASRAFSNAAMLSCEDMMKYGVYEEFRKLGKVYPFVPEQLGYIELPAEMARPKSLRGYRWDIHNDLLVDPAGKKLLGEHKIKLRSQPGTGIQYPWPKNAFPKDPTIPPPPRRPPGQQTPRLKVTGGGSSQAKATQPSSTPRAEAHIEKAPGEDEEGSSARQGSSLTSICLEFSLSIFEVTLCLL